MVNVGGGGGRQTATIATSQMGQHGNHYGCYSTLNTSCNSCGGMEDKSWFVRLNKLDDALECLKGLEKDSATMLLKSQILFRQEKMDALVDIYQKHKKSKIVSLEINLVAGLVCFGRSSEVQVVMDAMRVKATNSFELTYNTARYAQWRSRFLRYIDTRPNGDALKKYILEGPYTLSTVVVPAVPEAIHLILTGIRDEIYSTVEHAKQLRKCEKLLKRYDTVNHSTFKMSRQTYFGSL
nr:signal recognition particle subunit SRP72 [Tanacetum cinerariifolium]